MCNEFVTLFESRSNTLCYSIICDHNFRGTKIQRLCVWECGLGDPVTQLTHVCVTGLTHICDRTHSYMWHDSLVRCAMTTSYSWHDSLKYSKSNGGVCQSVVSDTLSHNPHIYVTWLTHACDMTHSHMWHDSLALCAVAHSYMWHNSLEYFKFNGCACQIAVSETL